MSGLLNSYSIEDILIIIVAFVACIFGVYKAICFFVDRFGNFSHAIVEHEDMPERVAAIEQVNKIQNNQIELLLRSDRQKIKGEIIKQYQYFTRLGYIDADSLEYLHQIYDIYQQEGGNSYVHRIMDGVDDLKVIPAFSTDYEKEE